MKQLSLFFFVVWVLLASFVARADCNLANIEKFDTFFSIWSSNKQFSIERTIFPLKTIKYDSGGIEPKPIYGLLSKVEFERSPSTVEHMKANFLQYSVGPITAKTATVKIFKEGTDWQYEYRFQNRRGCWYFFEFKNQSL